MEQFRNVYRALVEKPEGKRPLGRPRCRWEDNISMDFKEVGWVPRDCIALVENRVQIAGLCKGDNEPPGSL